MLKKLFWDEKSQFIFYFFAYPQPIKNLKETKYFKFSVQYPRVITFETFWELQFYQLYQPLCITITTTATTTTLHPTIISLKIAVCHKSTYSVCVSVSFQVNNFVFFQTERKKNVQLKNIDYFFFNFLLFVLVCHSLFYISSL